MDKQKEVKQSPINKVEFCNGGIKIDGTQLHCMRSFEFKKESPFASTEITVTFSADVIGLVNKL